VLFLLHSRQNIEANMSLVSSKIDSLFSAFSGDNPGCAIGVLRDGETVLSVGYGMADLEHGIPFTPASVCYMGSVSKQFTALTTLLVAEDGKLTLDDTAKSIIPELPDCMSAITVRHLLTHSSGLRDYFFLGYLSGLHSGDAYSEDDIIRLMSRQEALNFEPGKEYTYGNTGYVLLSIIVKRVTGRTLDEVAREKIFAPLGMKVSRFQHDHSALVAGKVHGYDKRAGAWHTYDSMLDVVGDGGMYSSVEDMLLWMKNFERPTVGAQALKLMQTEATLDNGKGTGYGMGLGPVHWRGLDTIGHSGMHAGYRTMFRAYPSEKTSIVVLCNSGEVEAWQLVTRVAEVFLASRIVMPANPPPASASPASKDPPPEIADDLVGDYESSELRTIYSVARGPEGFTIVADRWPAQQLQSAADDRMRIDNWGIEIQFHRDQNRKPTGFSLSSNDGKIRNLRFRRL
jgi:CubicO group peptidase (beta-lactamase class C family)